MRSLIALLLVLFVCIHAKKSAVREVKTYREFQALLEYHKTKTGLGVIVDFYSDSCGPCRQIAPFYKQLADQYKGKVIFAKVNVQRAQEISSRLGIRSMPTFHFYHLGKKKQEFSGADSNRLQQGARSLSKSGAKFQVEITEESLTNFYAKHDSSKQPADVRALLDKNEPRLGHFKLATALEKKYGSAPKTIPFKASKSSSSKKSSSKKGSKKSGKKDAPAIPNLHLATIEELQAELLKRQDDDDYEEEDDELELTLYTQADTVPERVVIIGAGPAGLAAAVYAARAGLAPVIIAPPMGGQLMGKGVNVENYPGIMGDTGPGIVILMMKQAAEVGCSFIQDSVTSVDLSKQPFSVTAGDLTVQTHSVIIATGANSRWLGVEGENGFRGGGVSTCATCDGFLFRDQPVVVIGGGDTAMEDALVLARTSSHVTVVHRRDTFRASKILAERVMMHEGISIMWNSSVESFHGTHTQDPDTGNPVSALTHVMVRSQGVDDVLKLNVTGAFVAIGHDPATELFANQLELDANNYIVTQGKSTRTSVEGVFAAGDVMDHVYRQAVTSAGSGSMAALDAERWLSTQGIQDVEMN